MTEAERIRLQSFSEDYSTTGRANAGTVGPATTGCRLYQTLAAASRSGTATIRTGYHRPDPGTGLLTQLNTITMQNQTTWQGSPSPLIHLGLYLSCVFLLPLPVALWRYLASPDDSLYVDGRTAGLSAGCLSSKPRTKWNSIASRITQSKLHYSIGGWAWPTWYCSLRIGPIRN